MRKAERILLCAEDAEDIVQCLFVDMLRSSDPIPSDLPYLYRAVTNRCLNHIRDAKNRARLLDLNQPELRGAARTELEGAAISRDLLLRLVDTLDDAHAQVLIYRFFDDMTLEEVAEQIGVSRKTVGKRIGRIRETVRALEGES